jgi:hypothetical protein
MARSKLARRYRRNSSSPTKTKKMKKKTWTGPPGRPPGVPWTKNPPMLEDFTEMILPGFGGYGATRLLGRITHVQVAKRWPRFGKHAAAISAVAAFGAAWFAAHRVKALSRYHTPIVVGAGIAALKTLVQTYLPWLGWMTADVQDGDTKALPAPGQTSNGEATAMGHSIFDEIDDAGPQGSQEWATYNDAFDKGSYRDQVPAHPPGGPQSDAAADAAMGEMLSELGVEDDLGQGIFAN